MSEPRFDASKVIIKAAEQAFIRSLVTDGSKRVQEIKEYVLPADAKQLTDINASIKDLIEKRGPLSHKDNTTSRAALPEWCQTMTDGSITEALIVNGGNVKLAVNAEYIAKMTTRSSNKGGELYVHINNAIRTISSWSSEAGWITKSNKTHPSNHFIAWVIEQLLYIRSVNSAEEKLARLKIIYEVIMWGHNTAKFSKKDNNLKKQLSAIQCCLKKAIKYQATVIEQKSSDDYLLEVRLITTSEIDSIKSAIFSTFLSHELPVTLINSKLREEKHGLFSPPAFTENTILPTIMKKLQYLDEDSQPGEDRKFYTEKMIKEGDILVSLGTQRHYCHFEIQDSQPSSDKDLKTDSYFFNKQNNKFYYVDFNKKLVDITQAVNVSTRDEPELNSEANNIYHNKKIDQEQEITLQQIILKYYKSLRAKEKSNSNIEFINILDQLSINEKGFLISNTNRALESRSIKTGFGSDITLINSNKKTREQQWKNFVEMLRLIEQMEKVNAIYAELQKCTKTVGEINTFVLMLPHIQMAIDIGREIIDKLEYITNQILLLRDNFTQINQEKQKIKIPDSRGDNIHIAAEFANSTQATYINIMREHIKELELIFLRNVKFVSEGRKNVTEAIAGSYRAILPIYDDLTRLGIQGAKFNKKDMAKAQEIALTIADQFDMMNTKAVQDMRALYPIIADSRNAFILEKKPPKIEKKAFESIEKYINNKIIILNKLTDSTPSIWQFWMRKKRNLVLMERSDICKKMIKKFENELEKNIITDKILNEKIKNKIIKILQIELDSVGYFAPNFRKGLSILNNKLLAFCGKNVVATTFNVTPRIDFVPLVVSSVKHETTDLIHSPIIQSAPIAEPEPRPISSTYSVLDQVTHVKESKVFDTQDMALGGRLEISTNNSLVPIDSDRQHIIPIIPTKQLEPMSSIHSLPLVNNNNKSNVFTRPKKIDHLSFFKNKVANFIYDLKENLTASDRENNECCMSNAGMNAWFDPNM